MVVEVELIEPEAVEVPQKVVVEEREGALICSEVAAGPGMVVVEEL